VKNTFKKIFLFFMEKKKNFTVKFIQSSLSTSVKHFFLVGGKEFFCNGSLIKESARQ